MKGDINEWSFKIVNLFMVIEVLFFYYFLIVFIGFMMYIDINGWDGFNEIIDEIYFVGLIFLGKEFFDFYGLQLIEGEWLFEKNFFGDVIINEMVVLMFGWRNLVGKQFYLEYEYNWIYYIVVGVVKDFSYLLFIIVLCFFVFVCIEEQKYLWFCVSIFFKFMEGSWEVCKDMIWKMKEEDFFFLFLRFYNEEEEYNKYLCFESVLMILLGIVFIVCVIIFIFGIFL